MLVNDSSSCNEDLIKSLGPLMLSLRYLSTLDECLAAIDCGFIMTIDKGLLYTEDDVMAVKKSSLLTHHHVGSCLGAVAVIDPRLLPYYQRREVVGQRSVSGVVFLHYSLSES